MIPEANKVGASSLICVGRGGALPKGIYVHMCDLSHRIRLRVNGKNHIYG